ncbi:hypothetical protein ACNI65_09575 [Roseateles sp. So40a]|uniref:hypothetical protein n=1 Tax=Roseateles sp. So40a TaxID=3400226 RepID=UPI003A8C3AFA
MNKRVIFLAVLNGASMLLLLYFFDAANRQAIGEARQSYDFGDSINALLFVAPAVLLCMLGNIVWFCASVWWAVDERRFRSAILWLIVTMAWILTIHVATDWMDLSPCVAATQCDPATAESR